MSHYCGYLALLGRPNVGKSTLFNRLLGQHIAAVTHKPHTTRCTIRGILDIDDKSAGKTDTGKRVVLIDTPGLHRGARHELNRALNRSISYALEKVRACVLIAECGDWRQDDDAILNLIKRADKPCILVINKVDCLSDKTRLLKLLEERGGKHDFSALVPLSARRDKSFDGLKKEIARVLPAMTPEMTEEAGDEDGVDVAPNERELIAELIREQVILLTHNEVPYATHVEVLLCEQRGRVLYCLAKIITERKSQGAILVGRGGRAIKHIGSHARKVLQTVLNKPVYLDLKVQVVSAWRNNPDIVKSYLYKSQSDL